MTAPVQTPSLLANPTTVALLRDLYAHARHVHAEHLTYFVAADSPLEHVWKTDVGRVSVFDDVLVYQRHGVVILSAAGVDSVRKAVELLAAIGVLPPRFAAMAPDIYWTATTGGNR